MRNFKKTLALTLALAMAFSFSAFAVTFSDSDKIDPAAFEAVETLAALNILGGDQNGNFNPEATITRAEAAKMIYVLANGGETLADQYEGSHKFADIVDPHTWADGYIGYAYSIGIVGGTNAEGTTYEPGRAVTGVELAKMLLTAAHYDADIEQYGGADWYNNIVQDAQQAGLFTGVNSAINDPMPRQWAAVMFANALDIKMARYSLGGLDQTAMASPSTPTVGEHYYDLQVAEGYAVANQYMNLTGQTAAAEGKTMFYIWDEANNRYDEKTYNFTIDSALLGLNVALLMTSDDEVYGVFDNGQSVSETVQLKDIDIKTEIGTTENAFFVSDYTMIELENEYLLEVDEITSAEAKLNPSRMQTVFPTFAPDGGYFTANIDEDGDPTAKLMPASLDLLDQFEGKNVSAMLTVIDRDDDGTVDFMYLIEELVGEITDYDTEDAQLDFTAKGSFGGDFSERNIDFADVSETYRLAKGDITRIVYNPMSGKIETMPLFTDSGVLTKISGDTLTFDREFEYELAEHPFGTALTSDDMGKEFTVYTYQGNIFYAVETEASQQAGSFYALMLQSAVSEELGAWKYEARLLLEDGSEDVFEIISLNGYDKLGPDDADVTAYHFFEDDMSGPQPTDNDGIRNNGEPGTAVPTSGDLIFSCVLNDDGTLELTDMANLRNIHGGDFENDGTVNDASYDSERDLYNGKRVDEETIFFVNEGGVYSVESMASVGGDTIGVLGEVNSWAYEDTESGFGKVVVATLITNDLGGGRPQTGFALLLDGQSKELIGDEAEDVIEAALTDGSEIKMILDMPQDAKFDEGKIAAYIEVADTYTLNSVGAAEYAGNIAADTAYIATISGADDENIAITAQNGTGERVLDLAPDCEILVVDIAEDGMATLSAEVLYDLSQGSGAQFVQSAIFMLNDRMEVVYMIVEASGEDLTPAIIMQ